MSAQERNLAQHSYQLQILFFKAALHMMVVPDFPYVFPGLIGLQTLSQKGLSEHLVCPSA